MKSELLQGFYLGDLLVEPLKGRVTGRAGSQHLPPKAVEVLLCLASTPGDLVTREALLDDVWGVGNGSQEALSHAISEIRHALADHPDDPAFLQTLPKRGYRLLVAPASPEGDTATIIIGAQHGARAADIGLLENLKQRGVLETAIAYLIVGWLLIQIADIVFAQLHMPPWVGTFVTMLVISGFPIAILLSWFLEFRDGRAIVHQLSPADARKRRFSRTYMSVVGALSFAAILVFVFDKIIGLPKPDIEVVAEVPALPPVLENSLAVLPFLNVDDSDETRIFANGLVDDVITRFSRVPGLLVSSRGDSHTLEPNTSSEDVRRRLRVAMYLEGSVQIDGDQIRVIFQLIDSSTGFHILSRSFDRPREDFFDIRDEITSLTVANVRVALPPETMAVASQSGDRPNLDTYVLYRRGMDAYQEQRTIEAITTSIEWFDAALDLDAGYAAAHAGKCTAYVSVYVQTDNPAEINNAENSCAAALSLNPNLDVVHLALGRLYRATGLYDKAETEYLATLAADPESVVALIGLGVVYLTQGLTADAIATLKKAIGLQPGDWSTNNALGGAYFRAGRYAEAAKQYETVIAIDPTNTAGYSNLGTSYMLLGDFDSAIPVLQKAIEVDPRASTYSSLGLIYYYLGRDDEAIDTHRAAIELAPNNRLVWSNLGDALWVADRRSDASDAFSQAEDLARRDLQVNPNDGVTLMDLAWIRAMLDDSVDARYLIDRANGFLESDPYVHYIDGLIWLRSGDADHALEALEMAADMGYSLQMLAAEPHLSSLRDDSRFKAIIAGD